MSHSGTKIMGQVQILGDLQPVLGTGYKDLGQIITNANINKWAFHKPFRSSATSFANETEREAAMSAAKCGLNPNVATLAKLAVKTWGYSGGVSHDTKEQCIAEIHEWGDYQRPRGAAYNEWFRLLDFRNYEHAAIAPDGGYGNVSGSKRDLEDLAAATVDETLVSVGNQQHHVWTSNKTVIFQSISLLVNAGSEGNVNPTTYMELPITLLTDAIGTNANWRICLAVWLASRNMWAIFPSRIDLYTYKNATSGTYYTGDVLPNLGLNPSAAAVMVEEYGTGTHNWSAIPILARDLAGYRMSDNRFCPRVVQNSTLIYSMPSGSKEVITLTYNTSRLQCYFTSTSSTSSGTRTYTIINHDTSSGHELTYRRTIATSSGTTIEDIPLNFTAGQTQYINVPQSQAASGQIDLLKQDGTLISEMEPWVG